MFSSLSTVYFVAIFVLDHTFLYWFIHSFAHSLDVEDQTQGLELVWQALTLDCVSSLSLCRACLLPPCNVRLLEACETQGLHGKVPGTHSRYSSLVFTWCLLLSHKHTSHSV